MKGVIMKYIKGAAKVLLPTLLCTALCLYLAGCKGGDDYEYTELYPEGWRFVWATSINDYGVVVGVGEDGNGIYKADWILHRGPHSFLLHYSGPLPGGRNRG